MEPAVHVQELRTINESRLEILSIRWNQDDSLLAVGCSDGNIKTYLTLNFRLFKLLSNRSATNMPVTSLSWRPEHEASDYTNTLLAATSDGWLLVWDVNSGSLLNSLRTPGDQCLCAEYSIDGTLIAAGCSDFTIIIYEAEELSVVAQLDYGTGDKPGHSNRIFSFRWINEHGLLSGGWDDTIILWDIRSRQALATYYGPHICGPGIDLRGDLILAASYSRSEQLQTFSIGKGTRVGVLTLGTQAQPCLLYSCQFSKADTRNFIAAVGREALILKAQTMEPVYRSTAEKDFFCCDWAHHENTVAVGSAAGFFKILQVEGGEEN